MTHLKVLVINTVPFMRDGIGSVIMNHYRALKDRVDFDFLVNTEIVADLKDEILLGGSNIFFVKARKKRPLHYLFSLKKILRGNKYDLIHIHGNSALMSLELLAIKNKKKVIVHGHNVKTEYPFLNALFRPYFQRSFAIGLVPTEEAGKFLFQNKNYRILSNGIDLEQYAYHPEIRHNTRKSLGITDEKVIICVGNLNRQKYQDLLLSILPELLKNGKYVLLLVGKGEREETLRKLAIEKKITNSLIFLDSVPNVQDYYSAADIFALPTNFESFGMVAIEAQANGLPCLVSDCVPQIVKKSEDFHFVSNDDLNTWINLILHAERTDNPRDLSVFDIRKISADLFDIYQEISSSTG